MKVLVIHENEALVKMIAEMFASLGQPQDDINTSLARWARAIIEAYKHLDCLTATSLEEATTHLEQLPELILCQDLVNGEDGLAFCMDYLTFKTDAKFVLMSSGDVDPDNQLHKEIHRTAEIRGFKFLEFPFTVKQLKERVEQELGEPS